MCWPVLCCHVLCCPCAGYVSRGALFKATSDALPALAAEGELWSSGVVSGELQVHWAFQCHGAARPFLTHMTAQPSACLQLPAVFAESACFCILVMLRQSEQAAVYVACRVIIMLKQRGLAWHDLVSLTTAEMAPSPLVVTSIAPLVLSKRFSTDRRVLYVCTVLLQPALAWLSVLLHTLSDNLDKHCFRQAWGAAAAAINR